LKNVAGNAIWLTEFKPINQEHVNFVELILQTLCTLGTCCAISGTYPAYIAGMLSSYFAVICIAKTNSTILDPLLRRSQKFTIGPFEFRLREEQVNTPDYTYEDISVPFQIVAIDTLIECERHSSLNFVEFIWNNLGIFRFKMYAIVAFPFDKPRLLYIHHY